MLGFEPGDDRKLPDWPLLLRYYQALAKASDKIDYRELGKTTLGAPFVTLVISSPKNLRQLDTYRRLNSGLADPRTLRSSADAASAVRDGKAIVLITAGVHSDEVGGHLAPAVLAYRLATDTSAVTRRILNDVILFLVPSLNPDGVTIVSRWYERTLGTQGEGTRPPELYHHYAGHDNNRDWYAFTQVETQLTVDSLYDVWHPQIVMDMHQQQSDGSRLFLPPYLDPIEPNVDPLLVDGANALGTAMACELTGQGKTGIAVNATFDAWTPSRAFEHYHGGIRILAEAASANLASPVDVPFDELAPGARFQPRERSWNFAAPWPGTWRCATSSYQTDAACAARQRRAVPRSLARQFSRSARAHTGVEELALCPRDPLRQRDSIALATMLGILRRGQVDSGRRAAAVHARKPAIRYRHVRDHPANRRRLRQGVA